MCRGLTKLAQTTAWASPSATWLSEFDAPATLELLFHVPLHTVKLLSQQGKPRALAIQKMSTLPGRSHWNITSYVKHPLITSYPRGRVNQRTENPQYFPLISLAVLCKSTSLAVLWPFPPSLRAPWEEGPCPTHHHPSLKELVFCALRKILFGFHPISLGQPFRFLLLDLPISPAFCSAAHDSAIPHALHPFLRWSLLSGVMVLNMLYTQMTSKLVSSALTLPLKCRFIFSNFDHIPRSSRGLKFILYEPKPWVFPTNHSLTVSSASGKVPITQVTQVKNLRHIHPSQLMLFSPDYGASSPASWLHLVPLSLFTPGSGNWVF